jgi:acetolactate synthase I/II/III large subunit
LKAAELFVKCLRNEGVTSVWGVPGEENAHMMVALRDSPIRFALTRHEQGAAFIAGAIGRLTGKAGVCLGTLGPGAANLVTGVADANMDRAPLVVLTGQADIRRLHKESHQAMDVVAMFKPITKWATPIVHPDNIPEVVRKAFRLAEREKPGACAIEMAEDISDLDARTEPIPVVKPSFPVAASQDLAMAVEAILSAKRPLILVGNGAVREHAFRELRAFAQTTGIGVTSTFMAKGVIGRSSPQCLFTIGLQARDYVACAVEAADLVVTVGYDLVEYAPVSWNPHGNKRIVHVDFLPAEVDEYYRVEVEVVGDVADTLRRMNAQMASLPFLPDWDLAEQASVRRVMLEDFAAHSDDDTRGLIRPQKILWDVREVLGPEDILLSDVGAHKIWIARNYPCDEPNTCLIPNGFAAMGSGLPGAIGAKTVFPNRRVLAICGDGGFLMNVQEMETARRLDTRIVVMVWEDKAYGLISWKQDNEFGSHVDLSFENPDWVHLAESFGWYGKRIEHSVDVKPALEASFQQDRPSLLVVPIDYGENRRLTARLGHLQCPG